MNRRVLRDDHGRQPGREWLQSLDSGKRAAAIAAIETYLTEMGQDVCATAHGKHLGKGLFEFRIRHDESVIRGKAGQESAGKPAKVLLRIFCHAYGQRIVLLLGGYDKGGAPNKKRQAARSRPRADGCAPSSCSSSASGPVSGAAAADPAEADRWRTCGISHRGSIWSSPAFVDT